MHRIGYLLSDGFQVMALPLQSVFEHANVVARESFYAVENFSVAGGEVRSSLGMRVVTRPLGRRAAIDTWIAAGVNPPLSSPPPAEMLAFLRLFDPAVRDKPRNEGHCVSHAVKQHRAAIRHLATGRHSPDRTRFARLIRRVPPRR